jgi:hypothetical protein
MGMTADDILTRTSAAVDRTDIEELLDRYLGATDPPELLAEPDFHQSLTAFVEKDEKTALTEYVCDIGKLRLERCGPLHWCVFVCSFLHRTIQQTEQYLRSQDPGLTALADGTDSPPKRLHGRN